MSARSDRYVCASFTPVRAPIAEYSGVLDARACDLTDVLARGDPPCALSRVDGYAEQPQGDPGLCTFIDAGTRHSYRLSRKSSSLCGGQ
jgi:hypothetical protein